MLARWVVPLLRRPRSMWEFELLRCLQERAVPSLLMGGRFRAVREKIHLNSCLALAEGVH